MVDSQQGFVAIAIAIISGGFGVWSVYLSRKTDKKTETITQVLSRSAQPIDSWDKLIKSLQDELDQMQTRHDRERKYLQTQIDDQRDHIEGLEKEIARYRRLLYDRDHIK